jgi:hypothetical protein
MKKYLISIILLFMVADLCFAQELQTFMGRGTYFEYSINYPSSWRAADMSGFAVIMEPNENKEKVLVAAGNLSEKPMSLEEFVNVWLKTAPSEINNFQVVDQGEATIDGKKALFHVYSGEKNGEVLKCKHYSISTGSNIYELTYEARVANFDRNLNDAEEIIKSIKISR